MSEKYKKSMDKIIVSDELKNKILDAADKKVCRKKISKMFYIRSAAALAACVALFVSVSNLNGFLKNPQYSPNTTTSQKIKNPENKEIEKITPSKTAETPQAPTPPEKTETPAQYPTENKAGEVPISSPNENKTNEDELLMATSPQIKDENLENIRNSLEYDFEIPTYIPDGFEIESSSVMFDSLIQIIYKNGENRITYRTQKCDYKDISGDYTIYENIEAQTLNSNEVTLKMNGDKVYTAIWNNEFSYSLSADEGLSKDEIIKIIESIEIYHP